LDGTRRAHDGDDDEEEEEEEAVEAERIPHPAGRAGRELSSVVVCILDCACACAVFLDLPVSYCQSRPGR